MKTLGIDLWYSHICVQAIAPAYTHTCIHTNTYTHPTHAHTNAYTHSPHTHAHICTHNTQTYIYTFMCTFTCLHAHTVFIVQKQKQK